MKKILSLLLVLIMVFSLTACGGSGGSSDSNNAGSSADEGNNASDTDEGNTAADTNAGDSASAGNSYEGVTLNFWSMWTSEEPQAKVIEEAVAAFEEQTGATINVTWQGRDINTMLSASLEAGDAIDIFEDDYNRIANIYAEYTADLTDMAAAANYADHSYPVFNDQTVAWVGYLNSIVEQPQVGGIFYDKTAFENAGITAEPTTWEEFLDVCQKIKDSGVAPLAQDSAYANFAYYYQLVRYLGEDGIAELRDNGGWSDSEGAIKSAQDIIDLKNAGYYTDGAPEEYPSSQNKIGLGQAAMIVLANYVTAEVNSTIGEVNWGLFNYPAVDGGVANSAAYAGANSLAISSYSENKQAAFDFIMLLVTGEFDQKMADTCGQIPADPANTAPASLAGTVETLLSADVPMSWCGSLNTHEAWQSMQDEFVKLFEGKYATGEEFAAAMDALY